jgi:hypothetical protein
MAQCERVCFFQPKGLGFESPGQSESASAALGKAVEETEP